MNILIKGILSDNFLKLIFIWQYQFKIQGVVIKININLLEIYENPSVDFFFYAHRQK